MRSKLFTLFFLLSCLLNLNAAAQKASVTIKESGNGKTFTVKKGRTFDVLFNKECVGCRYTWTISGIDSAKIRSVSDTHSNKSCTKCVGGTQDHTFHFKALKAGASALSFSCGDKLFSATVIVK